MPTRNPPKPPLMLGLQDIKPYSVFCKVGIEEPGPFLTLQLETRSCNGRRRDGSESHHAWRGTECSFDLPLELHVPNVLNTVARSAYLCVLGLSNNAALIL